jgi:monoamine oxidase
MRFPGMDWMDRVIGPENNSLVQYINAHLKPTDEPVKTIPYIFQTDNTFRLFNDKLVYNQATPSADTFEVLVSEGGTINNDTFAAMSPGTVFGTALNDLVQALTADFDTGFNKLMEYDQVSVRQYLLSQGYSPQQVDWLEAINDATMHYDTMSLSQGVIEEWIFSDAPLDSWLAVDGGMDRITDGMVKIISKSVLTSRRVTAIKPTPDGSLTAVVNGTEERNYAHVINTVPLGAMHVMDMTELDLGYRKKLAIRKLSYDPAGKIGMKFKTRWFVTHSSSSLF